MSKIILHIDLNAFFATCEEIKDPSLINKPLIVGGDGRCGIVSTCSYAARKYGIHSGMPTFQAKMLCKDLIIKDVDFKFYELMSREFFAYIRTFSKIIEPMSIDECFVDITESYKKYGNNDIISYLTKIQQGLYRKTKLKCSIGVATTKFLAKMASDIKKPMGITIVRNKEIKNIIFPLPIKEYFGIGKKTYPQLEKIGIKTIGDLYYSIKNNDEKINDFFGDYKNDIINQLEGKSSDEVDVEFREQKSIGVSRTLASDSCDKYKIKPYLMTLASGVIDDMLSRNLLTKTISICFKDANYETNFKTKMFNKSFKEFTDNKELILSETEKMFDKNYDGSLIRLVGFTVRNLKEKKDLVVQMTFDDVERNEKQSQTELLINELNRKVNSKKFFKLSELDSNGNK